jgi:imidazolonepropionase-like amidohydrolase
VTQITRVTCGRLFDGLRDEPSCNETIVIRDGVFSYVGPTAAAPPRARGEEPLDCSGAFVMPGLIDVHTHFAYGNAKTEEDIDLYGSLEFRTVRGLYFAQQVLAAGYTSICAPGDAGRVTIAIRDAINAGLFKGPRITTAGPYITSRQGLTDWYPTWIGVPDTAIGVLVRSRDEAIEAIRCQVKDGVDCIKIAMDGKLSRGNGDLVAAFNQDETTAMVTEAHRLGRKVISHCRGREATLYSARAGIDLIFHASYMDDECLEAMLEHGCSVGPTLTYLRHMVDFTMPTDPYSVKGRPAASQREFESACTALAKAHKAGVPMLTGTDSGFAITPYGEWHAREIELFVDYLGMTPAEALRAATSVSASILHNGEKLGRIAVGARADLVVIDGDPLADVSILLDRDRFKHIILGGETVHIDRARYNPLKVSDFAMTFWNDLYTQERVAELKLIERGPKRRREIAEAVVVGSTPYGE